MYTNRVGTDVKPIGEVDAENHPASDLSDLLCDSEQCPTCGGEGERRYYPNEYDTLTQLYCSKCCRGFGAMEIA